MHALRIHYPWWIFPHTHHVLHNRYRHHDACMVHKWCTLFELTFPSLHSTYTLLKPLSGCIWMSIVVHNPKCIFHKNTHHIILKTIWTSWCIYGSQAMHTFPANYTVYISAYTPPYTQTTIDIKMDAWFTSQVDRSSSQSKVYILQLYTMYKLQ